MAVWALIMGCAMCIAQVAQINVNWLVLLIGVLTMSYFHTMPPLCLMGQSALCFLPPREDL